MTTINENTVTIEGFLSAINVAEKRWFDNRKPDTIKKGIVVSEDLIDARKWLNAHTITFINKNAQRAELTADIVYKSVSNDLGMKAIKRLVEFCNALHSGNYAKLDGVTALEILSSAYAGAQSRDAVFFAATGKGNESTSDEVKDIALVRKLQRALKGKTVGVTTESTQNSRSFGKNGFCKALNMGLMTRDDKGNKILKANKKNPFFVALAKMIDSASDNTLELVKGGKKK